MMLLRTEKRMWWQGDGDGGGQFARALFGVLGAGELETGQGWHRAADHVRRVTFLRPLLSICLGPFRLPTSTHPLSATPTPSDHPPPFSIPSLHYLAPSLFIHTFIYPYRLPPPRSSPSVIPANRCIVKSLLFHFDYTADPNSFGPLSATTVMISILISKMTSCRKYSISFITFNFALNRHNLSFGPQQRDCYVHTGLTRIYNGPYPHK